MPRMQIAGEVEPHMQIDWFHRHVDRLVVEAA